MEDAVGIKMIDKLYDYAYNEDVHAFSPLWGSRGLLLDHGKVSPSPRTPERFSFDSPGFLRARGQFLTNMI